MGIDDMEGIIQLADNPNEESYTRIGSPPSPNVMFVISEGPNRTVISIYRPKKFNWFQRWMFKFCFGIKIIQGREKIREYMQQVFWSPENSN